MPNIKSAEKRVRVAAKKTLRNKMIKSEVKTIVKKYDALVSGGNKAEAAENLKVVIKKLDQAGSKGVYHKNTISRKKSQLTRKLNAMDA